MTVSSTTNRNDYVGNGAVDTYSYTFRILDQAHLRVTVRDTSSPPVETTLTLTTHYTVTGVGDAGGGSVALVNGAFSWLDADGDLKSGYSLTIRRVLPIKQETDLRNQGSFYAETHEDQFDRAAMVAQQQQDEIDRSLKLPETEAGSSAATVLPTAANRASKFLAFDADGDPIAASGSGTPATAFAATVLDDTDADSAIQTYIAALTAEATVAKDDTLILGDTSESKGNKATIENLLKVVTLLTAETAPAVGDELLLYDLSAGTADKITLANMLKVIGGLTADTSPLLTDEYVFYDPAVNQTAYKATLGDILKIINSLTEDTTPDTAADFALVFDASAGAPKKVLLNKIPSGAGTTNHATNYTITAADNGKTLYATAGLTFTMPAIADVVDGFTVTIVNTSGGSAVTINRAGSEEFEIPDALNAYMTSIVLPGTPKYNYVTLRGNAAESGSRWFVVARRIMSWSGAITPVQSTVHTFAHGLGVRPSKWGMKMRVISAILNYSVDDEINMESGANSAGSLLSNYADATNIGIVLGGGWPPAFNKTTTGGSTIDGTNWRFYMWAEL